MPIRVFLLDDHELVREGVRSLLESDEDIEVVGEASTGAEALARIPLAKPDVAILDVRLEDGSGIEVCRDVRSVMPELVCLMLTSFADDEALYASVMAGASGYVLKQIRARDLIEDVKKVAGGASLMDPRAVAQVVERIANPPQSDPAIELAVASGTRILDFIAEGKTNRQIAEAMFLSEKTIKNYVTHLLVKLEGEQPHRGGDLRHQGQVRRFHAANQSDLRTLPAAGEGRQVNADALQLQFETVPPLRWI